MASVIDIDSEAQYQTVSKSVSPNSIQVLFFHAPWAAPCKQMRSFLDTLATTYDPHSSPNVQFLALDAEELHTISEAFDVSAVPLVVIRQSGQNLDTVSGSNVQKVRDAVQKAYKDTFRAMKLDLPDELSVTRRSDEADVPELHKSALPTIPHPNGSSSGTAKDLSAYVPTQSDAKTAPEFTSGSAELTADGQLGDELTARLQDLVKAAPVMLFMKGTPSSPQCGFSRQLVALLRERGVRYGFFNILADEDVRQGLKVFADWPTFPQLWVEGELVGGLDIVKEEVENDASFLDRHAAARPASDQKEAISAA